MKNKKGGKKCGKKRMKKTGKKSPEKDRWKKQEKNSVRTLADCEWCAAAPGLKPLRLPRAPSGAQ